MGKTLLILTLMLLSGCETTNNFNGIDEWNRGQWPDFPHEIINPKP